MLTSEMVKRAGKEAGADLVGIASMDRFEGAPKQQDPRYIFPEAKACIVLAFRIPRGYFRGIEEGTYFAAYPAMGYGGLNQVHMPETLRSLCCFIEDYEYEAAPVPNMYPGTSIRFDTQRFDPKRSRPVAPGLPHPDILVDFRVAAFAAGLGEIGYSKVFLTPEFGPRQRFCLLLTDAPLEPDPLFEGKLCDRCMRCVAECSGDAISKEEVESITVAGRRIEFGKLDVTRCSVAYCGGKREYNPFMRPDADEAELAGSYSGGHKMLDAVGYPTVYHHMPALEGARGCMRACMVHLEECGRLKKQFRLPFRQRKPWKLEPLVDDYEETGEAPAPLKESGAE